MLQIVEEAERTGAMSDLERDIVLAELREAYSEVKFGTECAEQKIESENIATQPEPQPELDDEADNEPEVEFEIIYNEEEDEQEEVEPAAETPAAEPVAETVVEKPAVESVVEEEKRSTFNSPLSTPKRSALLSLYEDAAPVVGEQFHEKPSVADTIACPKGVAESTPVTSLREAIGVADKFMLISELFSGNSEEYDRAIDALEQQTSFDDCIIYISENYTWRAQSEATQRMMELLQRKYNA